MRAVSRLCGGLLAAALLLLGPGTAWADGSVDVPAKPVTSAGDVPLSATASATERGALELRVTPPSQGGARETVVATRLDAAQTADGSRTLKYVLGTAPCTLAARACADGAAAPNGTWTVALVETYPAPTAIAEQQLASREFVLDVPAAPPTGVTASSTGSRTVTVRWARGPEPDLLHWTVSDGRGSRQVDLPTDAKAAQPCDANRLCTTTFSYAATDSGTRTYSVSATRACGQKDCTPVASQPAQSAPVSLPGPVGSSSPAATRGPSAGGSPSGVGTASGSASAPLAGGLFAPPPAGAPQLPRLPAPAVAGPEPDGSFSPTLGYADRFQAEPGQAGPQPPRSRLTTTGGGLLQDPQVLHGVAGALVLLLGGAHLRTWLARATPDP